MQEKEELEFKSNIYLIRFRFPFFLLNQSKYGKSNIK